MTFQTTSLAIIFALASLSLFIFSTKKLSTSLKNIGDNKFKKVIKIISKNNFISLLFGVFFTTLIQSSDGAMALIMGLLAAKFIGLKVAIAFLLGANIGTATTSLIVSFQSAFQFTEYFILFMFIGVFGSLLTKKERASHIFLILLSIGMVFFSLKIMSGAAKQIVKEDFFKNSLSFVAINPWSSFGFSFILTGIMQSSSATVTLYQVVFNEADFVLELPSAIALVFGANLGTTVTGLIVSLTSRNENSKKIAIIWGFTNLSISLLLLPFLYPFTFYADFIKILVPSQKALQLSIAHLFFNFILVFIYFWNIKYLEKLVNLIIKTKETNSEFNIILPEELLGQNASLALKVAKKALYSQGQISLEGIKILNKYISEGDQKELKRYEDLENIIDDTRTSIYNYLIRISSENLTKEEAKTHLSLILSSRSIDKIMGLGNSIITEMNKIYSSKNDNFFNINADILVEIKELTNLITQLLKNSIDQLEENNKERSQFIDKLAANINALTFNFAKSNVDRLKTNEGKEQLELDFDYSILLRTIERIAHHCQRINHYIKNSRLKVKRISEKEHTTFIELDK
ncbi:Na/Pi cotransporter family protein [Mesomycoplasma molare]|uniref:Na/Pi symporter n=1 Tax=Mesomycoplasma molare TaxID=171288 RepID=A0ABY5TUY8_9BACT|nr:Na/Pi symporter [Mesomycoplasma molare]UWD34474.1 Na/Pi symporter [Mesomycoplasma molare]